MAANTHTKHWRPLAIFLIILALAGACSPEPENGLSERATTATITALPQPTPLAATATRPAPGPTPSPPAPTGTSTQSPTPPPPNITLAFTGIIVPARCVQARIDELADPQYPYAEVEEIFQAVDLAIGTLNATISDFPPRTGCTATFLLTGGADNAQALANAGIGVMSVATNHIKNCGVSGCGDRAFLDTLDNLQAAGIHPVGAGRDLAQALEPVVVTIRGVRFGFVSLGEIESTTFSSETTPGIAPLTEENLRSAIEAARQVSDVVVAMPHWGPEYSADPNYSQLRFARIAVESGADLVVGNHTHVVQAMEHIAGVPVFYGLGNFVFDQTHRPDAQQGALLTVTFKGRQLTGYQLIPTHVDPDGRVHIAGVEEALEILGRIEAASQALPD
jgi:poly-gamma-glutamate synthesis protein (capsule biosynthesis protein)